MATFRAALRSLVHHESDLTLIARALNRIMRDSMDTSRFVTALYGEFDGKTGGFRYINCGHNPPVLLRAGGGVEMLAGGGPALGMWDGSRFEPGSVTLAPGDTLAVYTDGVVEVLDANDHQFGTERLARVLREASPGTARDMVSAVADATRAFAGRPGYDDDFTLVVVRRLPGPPASPR
jgi:sigma-B regulation protein RsbU (phosphoserine phosphatase)